MKSIQNFFQVHFQSLYNKEIIAYRKITNPSSSHTIILLHGQFSSSILYFDLFEILKKSPEFDIYAVDMRGFGDSSYKNPIKSLQDLADDVYLFINSLNLKNVSIAGLSTGGAVGQLFAATYPDVLEKLILLSSVCPKGLLFEYEEINAEGKKLKKVCQTREDLIKGDMVKLVKAFEKKDTKFWVNNFLKTCFNVGKKPSQVKLELMIQGTFKQRHIVEIMWFLHTLNISNQSNGFSEGTGEYKNIKTKTLIIHGDKDLIVPVEDAKFTYKLLGNKIAKLEIMNDIGHAIDLTKVPNLIKNFILYDQTEKSSL